MCQNIFLPAPFLFLKEEERLRLEEERKEAERKKFEEVIFVELLLFFPYSVWYNNYFFPN